MPVTTSEKKYQYFVFFLFILAFSNIICSQEDTNNQEQFSIWENTTKYGRVYHVDQKYKNACDTNSGAENTPLLTIGAALQRVKPGEKILIHEGVYHEMLEPVRGGDSPDKMISIESKPGDKVIIKGSKVIGNKWYRKISLDKKSITPSVTASRSKKLWMTVLSDTLFVNGYNPFSLKNLEEKDYVQMPSLNSVKNISPLALKRGMLYQDSKRMAQLNDYGDLVYVPGSFWVDTDHKTIHIHPFDDKNPNEAEFEVVVSPYLLKPKQSGLGFIQVKGLIFEHCANGFFPSENGAVTTNGGHHWIFEKNIISEINSYGLEFNTIALQTVNSEKINVQVETEPGFINVMDNKIYACGTAGIISNGTQNAILKYNEVMLCGWQEAEHYENCAGIKLFNCNHCLVSSNIIHHILGGAGIWLSRAGNYTRITKNIIYNIATLNGAIVMSSSKAANLIDNNFAWNIDGVGINGVNSDNQLYYHNLVGHTSESIVKIYTTPKRESDTVRNTANRNQVKNNMFVDFVDRMDISSSSNTISNNLFVFNTQLEAVKLKWWQARIISKRGMIMRADAGFNPQSLMFKWTSKYEIQPVPSLPEVKYDIVNEERTSPTTLPGPFRKLERYSDYYAPLKAERVF